LNIIALADEKAGTQQGLGLNKSFAVRVSAFQRISINNLLLTTKIITWENIKNSSAKPLCYMIVSWKNNDAEGCNNIKNEEFRNKCHNYILNSTISPYTEATLVNYALLYNEE